MLVYVAVFVGKTTPPYLRGSYCGSGSCVASGESFYLFGSFLVPFHRMKRG